MAGRKRHVAKKEEHIKKTHGRKRHGGKKASHHKTMVKA